MSLDMQRVAYRTRELQIAHPNRHSAKMKELEMQTLAGLKGINGKALIAYDWGESFVANNLVAKVAADETLRELASTAWAFRDPLLWPADNQLRDSDRSRRWSSSLVKFCTDAREENKAVLRSWIADWTPLATQAITAYCDALPGVKNAAEAAIARMEAFHRTPPSFKETLS